MLGPEWKYNITVTYSNWIEMQNWCENYIGEFDKDWYKLGIDPMMWLNGDTSSTWYFKKEKDIILFKLRWQ